MTNKKIKWLFCFEHGSAWQKKGLKLANPLSNKNDDDDEDDDNDEKKERKKNNKAWD